MFGVLTQVSITLEEVFLSGSRGNICVQKLEIQERRGCNVHVIVWNHIHTLNIHIIHSHLLQHYIYFHSNANHKINSQSQWSDFVSHIITCTVQAVMWSTRGLWQCNLQATIKFCATTNCRMIAWWQIIKRVHLYLQFVDAFSWDVLKSVNTSFTLADLTKIVLVSRYITFQ